MPDLRALIQALTPEVPLPLIDTRTTGNGIDAAGNVWVYQPPEVELFQAGGGSPFLPTSGGVMTGPLILAGDPVQPLEAASKQYVDGTIARAGGPFLPLAGGGTITNAFLRLDGPPSTAKPLVFSTNLSTRWQVQTTAGAETGFNAGSDFALYAYADNGGYIGSALSINRASGPQGQGGPYIYQLAPWRQITGGIGWPNGVIGNRQDIGQADRQPVVAMPANPFATTAGSPVITVTWPGSCNPSTGWIGENAFGTQTWLLFAGATAVGGITPSGWLLAQSIVDNDRFTIRWTSNATATVAAGGGANVTVRPSYCTTTNRVTTEVTFGGSGFPVQTAELYAASPEFPPSAAGLPRYEHRWHWTVGPNDAAGTTVWNLSGIEWDLTNRGHDYGYQPNIYFAAQPTVAFWVGPVSLVPAFASGGGTPVNWNSVYAVFSGQNDGAVTGVYQAFTAQPNSLVGQKFDPTGHGGVGVDLYGAYSVTPVLNPFSTVLGSAVVSVQMWQGEMIGQANGDQVYIPNTYTINGVTFGGGTYTMANVNTATGSFTIVGSGNATATGAGGGAGVAMSFLDFAPYAPAQFWGMFQHGISTAPGSSFLSGAILETQPGNAIQWSDGTGAAALNATATTPGNIGLTLAAAGTGNVTLQGNAQINAPSPTDWTSLTLNAPGPGTTGIIYGMKAGVPRWSMMLGDTSTESGGNAGSNLQIFSFADNGAQLGGSSRVLINRATGLVTCSFGLNVTGGAIVTLGTNPIQAGQAGAGNNLLLRPGAPGTGYADLAVSGIDGNVDLRLIALGTGTVRAMSPMAMPAGVSGLLTMQAGQAIRWSDGTNISTINVPAGANQDMTITVTGSGRLVSGNNILMLWGAAGSEQTIDIRNAAGTPKTIYFRNAASTRWNITSDGSAESGANAGSNFSIGRYSDAGAFLSNPFAINRATGNVSIAMVAAADDTAAAAAGVPVGALYQSAGAVRVRLT